jgi:hypothetical protein
MRGMGLPSVFKNLFYGIRGMGTRKAFVFSLDSFVAFILSVAALYSLLFFATVPSAYYSSLMQANYLAKDTMLALATSQAGDVGESLYGCDPGASMLSCIYSDLDADSEEPEGDRDEGAARDLIGVSEGNEIRSALIPVQFGYKIEVLEYDETPEGEIDFENAQWVEMYDTANDPLSANKKEYNKLKAATHILYFAYEDVPLGGEGSQFRYVSCTGEHSICEWPEPFAYSEDYASDMQEDIRGDAIAYVVRLTVYI